MDARHSLSGVQQKDYQYDSSRSDSRRGGGVAYPTLDRRMSHPSEKDYLYSRTNPRGFVGVHQRTY